MKCFKLRASRLHFALNLSVHALVFLVVALASLAIWLKWIALAFCLLSWIVAERARTKSLRYQSLLFDGETFMLVDHAGKEADISLRSGLWSTPWFIALPFHRHNPDNGKGVLMLFRDSITAVDWRQIRVLLRTQIQAIDQA